MLLTNISYAYMPKEMEYRIYKIQIKRWLEFIRYVMDVGNQKPYFNEYMSNRKGISEFAKWDDIKNNPDIPWNWSYITMNPNITLDIIQNIPDEYRNFSYLVDNPNITWEFIKEHWNAKSKSFTNPCDVLLSYNPNYNRSLTWYNISASKNITQDIILNYLDYPWDWWGVSTNPNNINKLIPKILDKNVLWNDISHNKHLSWDVVRDNPNIPWQWYAISRNMDWNIIKDNPQYPWDWDPVSENPSVSWDIIQANPDKPWNWRNMTCNPNITYDIIKNNPDKPWNFDSLFFYENTSMTLTQVVDLSNTYSSLNLKSIISELYKLTWNDVMNNPDLPWTLYKLLEHDFEYQLELIRQKHYLTPYVNKIRNWWLFKIYLNPFHRVGQKMLEKRYQEMVNEYY